MLHEYRYVLPQDKLALRLFEDCLVVGRHQHGHIFKLKFCLPQHTVMSMKNTNGHTGDWTQGLPHAERV